MIDGSVEVTPAERVYWKPFVWLAFAVASVVLPLAPTFLSMADVWNRDSTFTHGYVIPLLSAWLLWRDRAALSRVEIKPELRALTVVVALLAVWGAADLAGVQVVRQGAAVALIVASAWVVLGSAFVRAAMFPLAYLFFAVPFGDFLVPYLVEFTTHFTVAAVEAVGVPIYREGTFFSLPSGNFEVVKACSGVRYLIATVALGTLFCGISYSSWQRRLAFMTLCFIVPIITNGLRAFGVVMIAHYSNFRYAVGYDHLVYGWLFFGAVIGLLFWIGAKFADRNDSAEFVESPVVARQFSVGALGTVLAATVFFAAGNTIWRATAADPLHVDRPVLAAAAGEWRGPMDLTDTWRPTFAESDESVGARYVSSGGVVLIFARRYQRVSTGFNEAMTAALVPEQSWEAEVDEHGTFVGTSGPVVAAYTVTNKDGARWLVWRWHYIDAELVSNGRKAKVAELLSWIRHRRPAATVVCAVVPLNAQNSNELVAQRLLEDFTSTQSWRLVSDAEFRP